jgi:hypothetical protein
VDVFGGVILTKPLSKRQLRHWLFTVWVDTDLPGDSWSLHHFDDCPDLVYGCGQLEEAPDTGRLHFQIYTEWSKSLRFSEAAARLNLRKSEYHAEDRKGSRDQARDYCLKLESRSAPPYEYGSWRESRVAVATGDSETIALIQTGWTPARFAKERPDLAFRRLRLIRDLCEARSLPSHQEQ